MVNIEKLAEVIEECFFKEHLAPCPICKRFITSSDKDNDSFFCDGKCAEGVTEELKRIVENDGKSLT